MKIDITYTGALNNRAKEMREAQEAPLNSFEGKTIEVMKDGKAAQLTFTNEFIQFKNDTEEFFSKDINVQNADPNDIFSYKPKDQWLVFSQYLNGQDYFDGLSSEEVNKMESILKQITDGLDSLTQTGIDFFGGVNTQLDSYEAQVELVSSTQALHYFSDKFLSGETKIGFDQLIEQYSSHNTNKIENYQSIEEKFYAARAKVQSTNATLTANQAQQLSITNKLGKTKYSSEDLEKLLKSYTELFQSLENAEEITTILDKVKSQLLQFVTIGISEKDADYNRANQFVSDRVQDTIDRINGYWGMLLK
ncbi:hypothetical protein JFL43_09570 [Viridibacillus sp. YIM B01967]|uniref:Uncharacterized protein n=1 Tax=Viridibacillus soli TaxID=2798301 RepID=A0ABS1H6R7_9BACL|nr:hypothetical protein [Viridibacillus soli]MBK3495100.1 hypothetical protein [Viridibacillus soli]